MWCIIWELEIEAIEFELEIEEKKKRRVKEYVPSP